MLRPSSGMGKRGDLSDFGIVVGDRQARRSISETADLLGLSTESYQWFTEKGPEEKISSDQ